ncbi:MULTISPECIES: TetR/AcrR family transcriptional regulator [Corynebacterium]|uniref:TetR/AcrR family transcriptional regulator n=1 Tax=Corynebacterium TaxID=1716 RepID=UPI00124E524A|nr:MULTISPECIES: TetR/AcrR family transcriptional regulator [Corynebacterium]MBV7281831.1 TetR family transcriptional regulator [Corynebacterium sp. TAE3-ERU30]MBV7301467.1 TetR family transcriptional regulator [Corynebacterium sp. TAE3-ERU2]
MTSDSSPYKYTSADAAQSSVYAGEDLAPLNFEDGSMPLPTTPEADSAAATAPENEEGVTPEHVVKVALRTFATHGFKDSRLKAIASESGMSKRMIHYHFGDKRGLYVRVIQRAIADLRPVIDEQALETAVPVEGMRSMAEAIYDQITAHPLAARLLVMESQQNQANMELSGPFADQSQAMLHMEKLLMLGQDSGAFRPGISVIDIYTIIIAPTLMRSTYYSAYLNLYNVNLLSQENTEGMRRMAVDTVLSFLTSNMQSSGGMSYLSADATTHLKHDNQAGGEDIYSMEDSLYGSS